MDTKALPGLYSRQLDIITPDEMPEHIVIVGAGGIGSWTALCLAKMGAKKITIVDHDIVEDVNIAPQIYGVKEVKEKAPKAVALTNFINENMGLDIAVGVVSKWEEWSDREDYFMEEGVDVVIMAVDTMDVRMKIWDDVKYQGLNLVIDGRMTKELLRIFTVRPDNEDEVSHFERNLYPSTEVEHTPCTERAVAYNQFVIAGLIGAQVKHFAKDELQKKDIFVDLYNLMANIN